MGKSRGPPTVEMLAARAAARGYRRGAHRQKDQLRGQEKHISTTKKNQDGTLHRYVLWILDELRDDAARRGLPSPEEEAGREHCLRPGVETPDLATVKDFFRFYAATSEPRIDAELMTPDSLGTVAEWFFAGFARVTGTAFKEEDKSEVYHFIRTTLVKEGVVVNKHRPKYNFTIAALTRAQVTLWTKDDLIFVPERYRIQATFIINVFCWTGARLSAFFTGGLRYEDTEIVLQRVEGSRKWRLIWQLNQRWVKNNRDPENVVFGTAHKEHEKLVYNETGFLLTMAIADGALFGIDSVKDLQKKVILPGENELVLRYNESALKKPILRKCTKIGGVTDEPMPKSSFLAIWRSNLSNAGYYRPPTIHAIRRGLGKKIDKNYTPVQRGQHLTQADPRVFGQSYVANCSSVDGQGAFLEEPSDDRHIDYFQSVERFLEPGLPSELPARQQDELNRDARLLELQKELDTLELEDTTGKAFGDAKRRLANYRRNLQCKTLRQYRKQWVRERRDWKILTSEEKQPRDPHRVDLVQQLCLLIPERGRLAQRIGQDEPLSPEAMWQAMHDLYLLCTRDFTVLYLPGLSPLGGRCPAKSCQRSMDRLPKSRRNHHIQSCVRSEMAMNLDRLPSDIHYCHFCFQWVVGDGEWDTHCASHLISLTSKRCGTLSHCHTLVRPGYCPFHVGNTKLSPACRLQSWSRDFDLWRHVNDEIRDCRWPMSCPYPSCHVLLEDERALQFHFVDEHHLSRTRPSQLVETQRANPSGHGCSTYATNVHTSRSRKWKTDTGDEIFERGSFQDVASSARPGRSSAVHLSRKDCFTGSTVSPHLLSITEQIGIQPEDLLDSPLLPGPEALAKAERRDAESEHDQNSHLGDYDWRCRDHQSVDDLSSSASHHSPFCGFARPHSSIVSSSGRELSGQTMVAEGGSDFGTVSEEVDAGPTFDTLFDQYLNSHSHSPSAPSSADDGAREWSGICLAECAQPCAGCHTENLQNQISEQPRDHEEACRVKSGPRIRLRVKRPKLTLRLKIQSADWTGKKRKMQTETGEKGVQREKEKRGTKRQHRNVEKRTKRLKRQTREP